LPNVTWVPRPPLGSGWGAGADAAQSFQFGNPDKMQLAWRLLSEYNATHDGDFSRFNGTDFSLKIFGRLLPEFKQPVGQRPQKRNLTSGSSAAAITTASSCRGT
jgi:hypothetical protein